MKMEVIDINKPNNLCRSVYMHIFHMYTYNHGFDLFIHICTCTHTHPQPTRYKIIREKLLKQFGRKIFIRPK